MSSMACKPESQSRCVSVVGFAIQLAGSHACMNVQPQPGQQAGLQATSTASWVCAPAAPELPV